MIGKTSGKTITAGCRSVRRTERCATAPTCVAATLIAARWPGSALPPPRAAGSRLASPEPSSERPVLARKTSSSVGARSSMSAICRPSASSPRTTSARRSRPRGDGHLGLARRRSGSPKRSRNGRDRRTVEPRGRDGVDARATDLRLQLRRRALRDDPAVVDDPDAVGEHVRLLQVLRREEHGDAVLAAQAGDLLPERHAGSAGRDPSSARRGRSTAAGGRARARGRAVASCPPSTRPPSGPPAKSSPTRSSSSSDPRTPLGPRDSLEHRLEAEVVTPREERVERSLLEGGADRRRTCGPCRRRRSPRPGRSPTSAAEAS